MDDLLEIVLKIIGSILEGVYDHKVYFNQFDIKYFKETDSRDAYIVGLIATAFVMSYADDYKIDKEEKKIIKEMIKTYDHELSSTAKKNIIYFQNKKISKDNLRQLFFKLNIDQYTILKIIHDLERILYQLEKDTKTQNKFLKDLEKEYNKDYVLA